MIKTLCQFEVTYFPVMCCYENDISGFLSSIHDSLGPDGYWGDTLENERVNTLDRFCRQWIKEGWVQSGSEVDSDELLSRGYILILQGLHPRRHAIDYVETWKVEVLDILEEFRYRR